MNNEEANLYPQNPCARFGQSRFGPVKRTALDGKVWWRIYDYRHFVAQGKFKSRKKALIWMVLAFRHGWLRYEPDPGFSMKWLMDLTLEHEQLECLLNKPAKSSKGDS